MGLVGLMSRATGNLAGLAAGSSGVGSSVLPRNGAFVAVVADETPYRFIVYRSVSSRRSLSSGAILLPTCAEKPGCRQAMSLPGEAVFEKAAAPELPQHPLDHRPQRPVAPGEALGPDPQQLLQVALHEPVERRLARAPRLVDPAANLHAQTQAGGRGAGAKGNRR